MALGYILDPFIQVNTIIGTPVVGAKIYVYKADTSNLAVTYNDFEGHTNTNPVRTNTLGNCTIIAEDNTKYDIEIRDAMNLLLISKKGVSVVGTSGESSDNTVEAGYGIEVTRSGNTFTVAVDTDLIATQEDLADKQDKLLAGDNISIENNTVSVVNRREIVTEYPIKLERGNNRVKIYLDGDYGNQFKPKQIPIQFGGGSDEYISYIYQDANGNIGAFVSTLPTPPTPTTYTQGTGITITEGENADTISVDTSVVALKSEIPTLPYYIRPISTLAQSSSYTSIVASTGIADFTIVGNFDLTNGSSLAITTNNSSRNIMVFIDDADTPTNLPGNGSTTSVKSISNYDMTRIVLEIFGMGVGSNLPHWKYTIYTEPYVDKMAYWIIKEQEYDGH